VGIYLGRWFERDESGQVDEIKETILRAPENSPV